MESSQSANLKPNVAVLIYQRADALRKACKLQILECIFEKKLNFIEIAQQLIPEDFACSATVASEIVRKAARKILGKELYKEVSKRNIVTIGTNNRGKRNHITASLEAQGLSEWTEAERARLRELIEMPAFQYSEGWPAGRPIAEKIVLALNLEFYDQRPARTVHGIRSEIVRIRKEKGDVFAKRIAWERVQPTLQALLQQPEFLYPETAPFGRAGSPNIKKTGVCTLAQYLQYLVGDHRALRFQILA